MAKLKLSELGESVCVRLKGKSEEGVLLEKTRRGCWVIFYGEVPGVSLGKGLFMIYPNASEKCLDELNRHGKEEYFQRFLPEPVNDRNVRNNRWYEDCMKTHKRMSQYW